MTQTCVGLDVLRGGNDNETLRFLRARRCGLVTNHSGRGSDGTSARDALRVLDVPVVALFSPEHGAYGTQEGAVASGHTPDGLPIHSLYGSTRRPTDAMLHGIEVLVFDIQDVGARFYTYGTTLAFCLEECAARRIPLVVLDRPNPLGGVRVDGPALDDDCRSFVGHVRVAVRHGLTLGEMARLHCADAALNVDLCVVKVENWRRSMLWPQTGLSWLAPSPNLPDFTAAAFYPALCLLEFSGVSVGRGTDAPFQIVGAPWLDANRVLDAAQQWPAHLQQVSLQAIGFKPAHSVHEGETCRGLRLCFDGPVAKDNGKADGEDGRESRSKTDFVPPVALGLALLHALRHTHPHHFNAAQLRAALPLLGSNRVLDCLESGVLQEAIAIAEDDARSFEAERTPHLLYN